MTFSSGFAIKAVLFVAFCGLMAWWSVQNEPPKCPTWPSDRKLTDC
jgi:hypothetical protein